MIQYPLEFPVDLVATAGIATAWRSQIPGREPLECAIPPEFEGPGGGFSPEDYFALAVANCFVATFKVIAERSRVVFAELKVNGRLVVDRDEAGRPMMKSMKLLVRIARGDEEGASDRIRRVFEKTTQSCIVANSVKTSVDFELELN